MKKGDSVRIGIRLENEDAEKVKRIARFSGCNFSEAIRRIVPEEVLTRPKMGFSIPLAVAITILETIVAFIQAYVFTLFTSLYIGMASAEHEEHH